MNTVILTGRLATEPELKYTPSGVAVCEFRLAVDRPFKNAAGEREADFFSVKLWREQAESAANYLEKGRKVGIEGRLETRSWVAQDGSKRSVVEVVANRYEFLDSKRTEDGGNGGHASNAGNAGHNSTGYGQPQAAPQGAPQGARQSGYQAPGNYQTQTPAPAGYQQPAPAGASYDANSEPDFGDPFADQ